MDCYEENNSTPETQNSAGSRDFFRNSAESIRSTFQIDSMMPGHNMFLRAWQQEPFLYTLIPYLDFCMS